jgi:hypothetical protein
MKVASTPISSMVSLSADKDDKDKKKEDTEEDKKKKKDNQKFGLIVGLLEADAWEAANALLMRLRSIDPASHLPIAEALCKMLNNLIDPYYTRISYKSFFALDHTGKSDTVTPKFKRDEIAFIPPPNDVMWRIFGIMKHLSVHLSADLLVFAKLIRIAKEYVKQVRDIKN